MHRGMQTRKGRRQPAAGSPTQVRRQRRQGLQASASAIWWSPEQSGKEPVSRRRENSCGNRTVPAPAGEERSLSAQDDRLVGASRKDKSSARSVRNDSGRGVSLYAGAKAQTHKDRTSGESDVHAYGMATARGFRGRFGLMPNCLEPQSQRPSRSGINASPERLSE